MSASLRQQLSFYRGEHVVVTFTATGVVLTGKALAFYILDVDGEILLTRTTAVGGGVTVTSATTFTVTLTSATTGSVDLPAGADYRHEAWLTDGGAEDLIAAGVCVVRPGALAESGPPLPTPGALPLSVALGGTGATSFTAGTLIGGNGTSALSAVTVGSGLTLAAGTLTAPAEAIFDGGIRLPAAVGDAVADDTAAIQAALTAAGAADGNVFLPPGRYRVTAGLSMPKGVGLYGSHRGATAHVKLRAFTDTIDGNVLNDALQDGPGDSGTWFYVDYGAGTSTGAVVTLDSNCTIDGINFYWPNQSNTAAAPTAYPWAIGMGNGTVQCINPVVQNVQLLNAYQGIRADLAQRPLIRNVSGQPLYRGIYLDRCYDVPRIENVHWNPWWAWRGTPAQAAMYNWMYANGIGIDIGRSDWGNMSGYFCLGYLNGLRIRTGTGASLGTNWNVVNSGFDLCDLGARIDSCNAFAGMQFTNCSFTCDSGGVNRYGLLTDPGNVGLVKLVNCNFWLDCSRAVYHFGGDLSVVGCSFTDWTSAAIELVGGTAVLEGNRFAKASGTDVVVGAAVAKALVTGNVNRARAFAFTSAAGAACVVAGNHGQAMSGQSVLASDFSITAADGVFQDTGLSVSLPAAGTYLVTYNVRITVQTSAGAGFIIVRLYDATAAAEVADTKRLTLYPSDNTAGGRQVHSAYSAVVTVAAASTIRLQASSNGSPTWAVRNVTSDNNGSTTLGYVRVS